MLIRPHVYSPLQHAALWWGAWFYGHEATDALIDALRDLRQPHRVDTLREMRAAAALRSEGPAVRLVLAGPGYPSGLPEPADEYGALVVPDADGHRHHVLIAVPGEEEWRCRIVEKVPAGLHLSPGEADMRLADATRRAAELIEAQGYRHQRLRQPRLSVGRLNDFYETPGVPGSTPGRAAKLIARADRVAAIVETLLDQGRDHSLDTELSSLWRVIREARMVAVDYAVREMGLVAG
ncbi:hypothetical protein H7347_02945 [Corynebacterium sp. zg-331]|uniref:hypothetical protein n=1 Tax=unclassified Corynebacterium TaxID=2624378 RepID=UPI00128D330F|nr:MULTISPECIES: hypothetical protein [unclassified Corynebacterium]MBC3185541.1 hypothetical protein [Corynebacterium sp. zg-331]MPV52035.1 hypothetical protein [Corynebacterium sp. zg331]